MKIPKIGAAADLRDLLDRAASDSTIVEAVLVSAYKDSETGEMHFRYDRTRTLSNFRMAGALLWAANKVVNGEE